MAGPAENIQAGGLSPFSLVMRLELTSDSATDIESVCGNIVSTMKGFGTPYGGPIPLPKQRVYGSDGSHKDIHTRIIDLDTSDNVAKWLKSFMCPESVKVKCTVKEKRK